MAPWLCHCGRRGAAVSEDQAMSQWHVHAKRRGCSRLSRQALMDALAGQLVLAVPPGGAMQPASPSAGLA